MRSTSIALAALLAGTAATSAQASAAQLSTLAGSGAAGFADGGPSVASFLMPEGVAIAPNGDAYVADTAAQRIRRVSAAGSVTTVAGSGELDASKLWVPGGYANGSSARARFDRPSAVAVSSGGDVVVADTGNHCLRLVRAGTVSDYAGQCGTAGSADGAASSAQFQAPRALAFDARGALYVADFGVGIRRVAGGTVTTLSVPAYAKALAEATGLSFYGGGSSPLLMVAARTGMYYLNPDTATIPYYYETGPWDPSDPGAQYVAGDRPFGHPFAVAAVDDSTFVYTDIETNAIRYFTVSLTDVAAGLSIENAGFVAGAFADGSGENARVDQPMGIARRGDGAFVIADAGNRRIRVLSPPDFRYQTDPKQLAAGAREYRIAYIGDSVVSSNQTWDQSIAGILERNLRPNWRALGFPRPPRVYPIQLIAGIEGTADYVNTYLAGGLADMVIMQLNSGQIAISTKHYEPASLVPFASEWQPLVTSSVRSVASNLSKAGVPFVVVTNPMPFEISPAETVWMNVNANASYRGTPAPPGDYAQFGPLLREAVAAAGVQTIDTFPAFEKEELAPVHAALFAARDPHLSVKGVELNARVVLENLLRTRPWKNSK